MIWPLKLLRLTIALPYADLLGNRTRASTAPWRNTRGPRCCPICLPAWANAAGMTTRQASRQIAAIAGFLRFLTLKDERNGRRRARRCDFQAACAHRCKSGNKPVGNTNLVSILCGQLYAFPSDGELR